MEKDKKVLTINEFKEKVEVFKHLKEIGFLNDEELEKFKNKMLEDIQNTGLK